MKVFDDKNKKLFWWNRNYFFAGTVVVVLVNVLLFACLGNSWESCVKLDPSKNWGSVFYFNAMVRAFLNAFSHANWQHVLLNMLCFFVCGLYLERKMGTFNFILFILSLTFFTSMAVGANDLSLAWHGFSGVVFGLYGYIIIDYIFSFRKGKRNKFNMIFGGIVVALIYLAMCFNGGATSFGFEWYPYDLMHNMGHYSSIIAGIIVGLLVQIVQWKAQKEMIDEKK